MTSFPISVNQINRRDLESLFSSRIPAAYTDCAGFVIRKTGILASESLFVIRSYHKSRKNFPLGPDSGHQLYTIRVLEGREAAGFVIRSYHEFGTGKHMKSTRELRIKHAPFESTLV